MDVLRLVVQNLIIVIVLAVLLDMIIPEGPMRSYINMVIGLMVIVAVLQAVNGLTGGGLFKEIKEYTWRDHAGSGGADILGDGKKIALEGRKQAVSSYVQGLEKQVSSLAGSSGRFKVVRASVCIQDDPEALDFGSVKSIDLVISGKEQDHRINVNAVQKIEAGRQVQDASETGAPKDLGDMNAANDIKRFVAGFYGLDLDRVVVKISESE